MNVIDYRKLIGYIAKRMISPLLWYRIQEEGLEEDFRQEFKFLAWKLEQEGLPLKEASNYIQRHLYRVLKAYGFFRPKNGGGYYKRESPLVERELKKL